jgi:hypothetical protein
VPKVRRLSAFGRSLSKSNLQFVLAWLMVARLGVASSQQGEWPLM